MGQTILIMSMGQSNADCHDAGPALETGILQDPRIVVPNDGYGFRGRMGQRPAVEITEFVTAYAEFPKAQSIGMAAAARLLSDTDDIDRIIIRSGARGGRPMIGRWHKERQIDGIFKQQDGSLSPVFDIILDDLNRIITAADDAGHPIDHVYLPLFHGEADQGTPCATYHDNLVAMMDAIDDELDRHDLIGDWLATQPSGTLAGFAGNNWPNRLVPEPMCRDRENAHFACANYGFEMFDNAHLAAPSKALIGETLGRHIAALRKREDITPTRLTKVDVSGDTASLTFDAPNGLAMDDTRFPAPHNLHGFEITRQLDNTVQDVQLTGTNTVAVKGTLPFTRNAEINYAFSRCPKDLDEGTTYPFGRGCLREDWSEPSLVMPGHDLLRWIPSFSISLNV